jgi:hypothetical protein
MFITDGKINHAGQVLGGMSGQRETPWPSWLGIWRGVCILETPATEDNEPKTALNETEEVAYDTIIICMD